jgi:hypothetical protein
MTPWGLSTVPPDAPRKPGEATANTKIEAVLKDPASMAKTILNQVKVDKKEINLLGYETSKDEVHISNNMPGTISISVSCPPLTGFHLKLDKTDLGPKETAALAFEYNADEAKKLCGDCVKLAKPKLVANVRIQPTAQVFPIKITFAIPPELQKRLPKELQTPVSKQ